jgi:GR25 family glycosyltransferase involved in LPS biosynthesis
MTTEAHVINLASRTDRWEQMKESWKDQPITLVRRDAIKINGDDIPDAYHAVFLKHREILTTAQKLGEKHILIMEDDAVPCKDFAASLDGH